MTQAENMKPDDANYFPVDPLTIEGLFQDNPLMATIHMSRIKFVSKMLSPDDVVLELGAGYGYGGYFYSKVAKYVTGMDLYVDFDESYRRLKTDNFRMVRGDILSPPDEIFDPAPNVITSTDVIEHFHKADGLKIIEKYSAILPRGGMMITGSPSAYSLPYRSQQSKDNHFYEYEPFELKDELEKHFSRVFLFSMNDEVVHTGFEKLAWYFFLIAVK